MMPTAISLARRTALNTLHLTYACADFMPCARGSRLAQAAKLSRAAIQHQLVTVELVSDTM